MALGCGQQEAVLYLTDQREAIDGRPVVGVLLLRHGLGLQPGRTLAVFERASDQAVDGRIVPEADLGLGRVDVDVELRGVQFEKQQDQAAGLAPGVSDGPVQRRVANRAAVDEQIVAPPPARLAGQHGSPHPAAQARVFHLFQTRGRLAAKAGRQPLLERAGLEAVDLASVKRQGQAGVGKGQRKAGKGAQDMAVLGAQAAHEAAAGRGVVEHVPDLDTGADRRSGLALGGQSAGLKAVFGAELVRSLAGQQSQAGDRGDAWQGFAPKAEGLNPGDIGGAGNLAGGKTLTRQADIFGGHARTVIGDLDQPPTALLDLDSNRVGAGIQGVFNEFLDHAGRSLNDLAGGNLLLNVWGQNADFHVCPRQPSRSRLPCLWRFTPLAKKPLSKGVECARTYS